MNWNCRDTARCLERNGLSELAPTLARSLREHAAQCPSCASLVSEERCLDRVLECFFEPALPASPETSAEAPAASAVARFADAPRKASRKVPRLKRKLSWAVAAAVLVTSAAAGYWALIYKRSIAPEPPARVAAVILPRDVVTAPVSAHGAAIITSDPDLTEADVKNEYIQVLDRIRDGQLTPSQAVITDGQNEYKTYVYTLTLPPKSKLYKNFGPILPIGQSQEPTTWVLTTPLTIVPSPGTAPSLPEATPNVLEKGSSVVTFELVSTKESPSGAKTYEYKVVFPGGKVHTLTTDFSLVVNECPPVAQ